MGGGSAVDSDAGEGNGGVSGSGGAAVKGTRQPVPAAAGATAGKQHAFRRG
jgi:hypothetical protein